MVFFYEQTHVFFQAIKNHIEPVESVYGTLTDASDFYPTTFNLLGCVCCKCAKRHPGRDLGLGYRCFTP